MKKIAIIVGSLRRDSIAKKIAKNIVEFFPEGYEAQFIEIGDLPLYNADYDTGIEECPSRYTEFRNQIKEANGVIFVTPENNRIMPACIKNAIDIGSKPNGQAVWMFKPTGILSHSIGKMGGYSSQKTLRLALSYFEVPIVQQPEVFLGNSNLLIDESGKFNNESTIEFVKGYLDKYFKMLEEQEAKSTK